MKPDKTFRATADRFDDATGRNYGVVSGPITGDTFFLARAKAAVAWGVDPMGIRLVGGKAVGS